jgi:hypothetical protein
MWGGRGRHSVEETGASMIDNLQTMCTMQQRSAPFCLTQQQERGAPQATCVGRGRHRTMH